MKFNLIRTRSRRSILISPYRNASPRLCFQLGPKGASTPFTPYQGSSINLRGVITKISEMKLTTRVIYTDFFMTERLLWEFHRESFSRKISEDFLEEMYVLVWLWRWYKLLRKIRALYDMFYTDYRKKHFMLFSQTFVDKAFVCF